MIEIDKIQEQKKTVTQKITAFFTKQASSLTYLNVTQFLGALNDNIFKLLIAYFLIDMEGIASSQRILATAGAIFVIPFLLFSSTSGTLADRLSKSKIIVFTKALELLIMLCGVLTFYLQSKYGSFAVLFLMATQSAIFGPSKYGIIPEIVSSDKISKANGLLTSFTFLAIIIGTFLASFLTQITDRNFLITASCCVLISLVGLITSVCIQYTPPSGSSKKCNPWFFVEVYQTIRAVRFEPSLVTAMCASAFFLFLGAFFQLNMIPYAVQVLHMTDVQGGYLFLITALGIGIGSMTSGYISGKQVELGLVPLGGLGVVMTCFMIDGFSQHLMAVYPIVFLMGFFGGIYIIPLDSFIQYSSPALIRGQVVATANFLSFLGVLLASAFLYVASDLFGIAADTAFSIIGVLTLVAIMIISYQFYHYLTRFVAMVISRLRFSMSVTDQENPPNLPSVYVCRHTAWNDILLLMGAQRRRMRVFIEKEQEVSSIWLRRVYSLMRVIFIPEVEPIERNAKFAKLIKKQLEKGFSICILVEEKDVQEEVKVLSEFFKTFMSEVDFVMVPVEIDKGEKEKEPRFFTKLGRIFRTPAQVTFHSSQ